MCAIAGWFNIKLRSDSDRVKLLVHLSRKIQAGGDKSFGVAWLKDGKGQLTRYTGPASQWLQQNIKDLGTVAKSSAVLLHARQPTQGNVTKTNTHPFHVGHWYAAHNGVIRNSKELHAKALYVASGETDSEEAICYLAGESWSAEALGKLEGYYAFEIMRDNGSQVVLIADTTARLHYVFVGDGIVWATDEDVLTSSLKAVGISCEPVRLKSSILVMPGKKLTEFKEGLYTGKGSGAYYSGYESRSPYSGYRQGWDDETGMRARWPGSYDGKHWDYQKKEWVEDKKESPNSSTEADGLTSMD